MNDIIFNFNNYTDVALYKPAFQSSLYQNNNRYNARTVLNNEIVNDFSFHTQEEENPWWYVDLIYPYFIDYIVIYDRPKFSYKSRTLKVEISLDLMRWEVIHEGLLYNDESGLPFILPLSGLIKAKYVRLSINEKHYFHLKKVSILVKNDRLNLTEKDSNVQYPLSCKAYNKLNVAILGTSNSIINGYKEALNFLNCNIVKNVSVGSSHSSIIPYRLKQLENIQIDYLIVDIFVNEHRANNFQFDFGELTEEILRYLLVWCESKKIIPVLLIMPTNITKSRGLLKKYIGWCKKNNILFFNGFKFIEELAQVWQRDYQTFFLDSAHLNNFMSRNLGIALNNCLMNISSVFSKNKVDWKSNKSFIKEFSYIHLLDIIDKSLYQIIERKTSMVSEKFLILKEGDEIELSINIKGDWEIVGLVLNMAKSNACITINSKGGRYLKYLDNDYFDPNKDLWLVAWNFLHPYEVNSNNIIIKCHNGKEKDSALIEYNDHRSFTNNNMNKYEISIEIAGVILRSKHLSQAYLLQVTNMDIDLLNNFNFDIFKDF